MEAHCPKQVVTVTAEDTDLVRSALQIFQLSSQTDGQGYLHENTKEFKSRSIIDAINFSQKPLSPAMQMADHCAFIIRRASTNCPHIGKYVEMIRPSAYRANQDRRQTDFWVPLKVQLDRFRGMR